ncbi:MAG: tetratricopeptide repeat protein [Nitrospirae bacterium]|nr:tetratricopeptide repeat protein [Nitrospirota bacterium]
MIGLLGLLAYSNTFNGPFQWDEADYIVKNPFIMNFDYFLHPSRAEDLLDDALISRYIGYLTFALNYRLHGFDVTGYHVVNLAIHITNAILVYFMVLLTLRTPYFEGQGARGKGQGFFPLAVALLFVAHPVQTEAVTYVFQRFASLVGLFYLLSLALYIKGRVKGQEEIQDSRFKIQTTKLLTPNSVFYVLSLISAVLAMKTKENAFTLPVVITLYEFLFFTGAFRRRLLRLVPFLLTMLIVPLTIITMESGDSAGEIMGQMKDPASLGYRKLSGTEYLLTQFRVVITYIRLIFLPVSQNINYDYPVYRSFFTPPVLLSFLVLSALFGTAVYLIYKTHRAKSIAHGAKSTEQRAQSKEHGEGPSALRSMPCALCLLRLAAFGILWFFITLSVESSVIPIPMVINEYRVYLPSAGFFLALVSGVLLLFQSFPVASPQRQKVAVVVFGTIILVLASATYARNSLWGDRVSLWEDAVSKSPGSPRGYNNLGIAYSEKGQYEKAIAAYEYCISLYPSYRTAYVNLGVAYAATGRVDKAIGAFTQAVALDPKNSIAYINLGRAFNQTGRPDKAVENHIRAIEIDPNSSSAYHGLGTAYVRLGRLDDALAAYSRFAEISPYNPEAFRNRGVVYADKGDLNRALADFQKSCSLGSRESCEYLRSGRFR